MRPSPSPLAELHVHLYGSVRPVEILQHLARCDEVDWAGYEAGMVAAYGFVPPMRRLVERFGGGDQAAAEEFSRSAVVGDEDGGSFSRFQAKGYLYFAGTYGDEDSTREQIRRFTDTVSADFARSGVSYAEIRTSAHPFLLRDFDTNPDTITRRMAVSLDRTDPWPEWERVVELTLGPHGAALTGVDFCGDEEGHPPKKVADFFAEIRRFNQAHPERALAILYHIGESFQDKSLESAVRWVHEAAELGAHRLGHAIALGLDPIVFGEHTRREPVPERRDQILYDLKHQPGLESLGIRVDRNKLTAELRELDSRAEHDHVRVEYDRRRLAEVYRRQRYAMDRVRSTGAVVEVCPTSNMRISGIKDPADHPMHRFIAEGVPFVVCSDDPGLFGTTLRDELEWVCLHTGGGDDLRHHLIESAWRYRSEALTGRLSQ